MKKVFILFLMFVATPAMAITCGDSDECNNKSTAAQKCADLGYSLNKVENCEHYLKCPFDTQYQKCVKYPKVSCQSLGFTQTTPCDFGKTLTCTDSDGSIKYQCLEKKSEKGCQSYGFLASKPASCTQYAECQDPDGTTYYACKKGSVLYKDRWEYNLYNVHNFSDLEYSRTYTTCDADRSNVVEYCLGENSNYGENSNASDWFAGNYNDDPDWECYRTVYCLRSPESVIKSGEEDSYECTREDPNNFDADNHGSLTCSDGSTRSLYYCKKKAGSSGSGGSGGGSGSGEPTTLCGCKTGWYINADNTCSSTQKGNSVAKIYYVSEGQASVVEAGNFNYGCFAKAVALETTKVNVSQIISSTPSTKTHECFHNIYEKDGKSWCGCGSKGTAPNPCGYGDGSKCVTEESFYADTWQGQDNNHISSFSPQKFGNGNWYVPTFLENKKAASQGLGSGITSTAVCKDLSSDKSGQFFTPYLGATQTWRESGVNYSVQPYKTGTEGDVHPHILLYSCQGCTVRNAQKFGN